MNMASIHLGPAAIHAVYERALASTQVDFVCLATNYEAVLGEWYETEYAPRLYDGKRQTREVVAETRENRAWALKKHAPAQVRFQAGGIGQTDVIVTPTWAALVTFHLDNPGVVVFEDPEVVATLGHLFRMTWNQAQE